MNPKEGSFGPPDSWWDQEHWYKKAQSNSDRDYRTKHNQYSTNSPSKRYDSPHRFYWFI